MWSRTLKFQNNKKKETHLGKSAARKNSIFSDNYIKIPTTKGATKLVIVVDKYQDYLIGTYLMMVTCKEKIIIIATVGLSVKL